MRRRAIVLMNLGGPDSLQAVEPFLYNLFSDPAIIRLPGLLRRLVARLIARRRGPLARGIYQRLGGGSPLVANTEAQARTLEAALGDGYHCFVAMRYWHPLTEEAVRQVREWRPDEILCLPLYPQFSTTTTASSLAAWHAEAARQGLAAPTRTVCCYPTAAGLVEAIADAIRQVFGRMATSARAPRLLLSAHGLPERIVRAGDPYQHQVEATAAAVVAALGGLGVAPDRLDWQICYQSRVGPLKWIGPSVEEEVRRAGAAGVALIIAPISFVSEHSETLVELDMDYRRLAAAAGVPAYERVPTVGTDRRFIAALAHLVRDAASRPPVVPGSARACEGLFAECPLAGVAR